MSRGKNAGRSHSIVIIIYLSWSWATCWPVPVSRIQKSLQRSAMISSFRETCQWLKFPPNGLRAQSRVSPMVGLLRSASGQACLGMEFPPFLMKQLYRCDSFVISSFVRTGYTTRRWGWLLGRIGYSITHHYPLYPPDTGGFQKGRPKRQKWEWKWGCMTCIQEIKVKLSPSTPQSITGGAELQLHSFLTSTLDGSQRPTSRTLPLCPRERSHLPLKRRLSGTTACLEDLEKIKHILLIGIGTPNIPARSLDQCFSTAGPRPGTGPWPWPARGSPGILSF